MKKIQNKLSFDHFNFFTWLIDWFAPQSWSSGGRSAESTRSGTKSWLASTTCILSIIKTSYLGDMKNKISMPDICIKWIMLVEWEKTTIINEHVTNSSK